jgi:RNA polymerase sigma-70 factor (ECF subfamily)
MNADKHLLAEISRRNPEALRRLYEKYKEDLFALALAVGGDRSTAEDALQDVFVAVAWRAGEIRLRKNIRAYLASMIVNRMRNLHRRQKTDRQALAKLDSGNAPEAAPASRVIAAEDYKIIHRALRQLPAEQAEVVWLHLHAGLSFRQIAETNDLSVATAVSRYRYGLQKMRMLLDGKLEIDT